MALILQACPICFEDFDDERGLHSIPCGHTFCRACLNSMRLTPKCPICRMSYTSNSIRKIFCALAPAESNEEKLIWQTIQRSLATPNGYEQRRLFARRNSSENPHEPGLSTNIIITMDMLQMLVRAEELNQLLNSKLYTARFVEARLDQRISTLETLLRVRTREADANFREMELLTAQVRGLQLKIKALNDVQYHGAISPGLVPNAGQSAQSLQQPSSLARARVIYAAGSESGSGLGVTPTMRQLAPISNETFVLARRLLLKQSMHPGFWGGGYVGLWLVPSHFETESSQGLFHINPIKKCKPNSMSFQQSAWTTIDFFVVFVSFAGYCIRLALSLLRFALLVGL